MLLTVFFIISKSFLILAFLLLIISESSSFSSIFNSYVDHLKSVFRTGGNILKYSYMSAISASVLVVTLMVAKKYEKRTLFEISSRFLRSWNS
jgi:uncharacterized protein YggT (Ycf19 family)